MVNFCPTLKSPPDSRRLACRIWEAGTPIMEATLLRVSPGPTVYSEGGGGKGLGVDAKAVVGCCFAKRARISELGVWLRSCLVARVFLATFLGCSTGGPGTGEDEIFAVVGVTG
jgi:hypothetical protein